MAGGEPTLSSRGFKHYDPVPSSYGGEIKISESSAAMHPHIWVWTSCPVDLNDRYGEQVEASVHLRLEDAMTLRDQLTHLIANHYNR